MAITVVQSKVIPGAYSGSFSSPTAAGNCVIAAICADGTTSPVAVSGATLGGSAGNFAQSANAVTASKFSSTFYLAAIWADPNCAGGQTSVAVSGSNLSTAGGFYGITIMEIAGLALTGTSDKASSNFSASAGTSWTSGATAATSQPNEICIGAVSASQVVTLPGSPWTSTPISSSTQVAGSGYQIASTTGTPAYSGSMTSGGYAACVATFAGVAGSFAESTVITNAVRRAASY